jgi:branched-chain amino acid transport system permease protein
VLTEARLVIVAMAAALILAAHLFIRHTSLGRAMRATFQDTMAAKLVGIRTQHVYASTFALGTILAGVAGMLLGSIYVAQATIGGLVSLKAFVVVILGGIGSVTGAAVGGIALGVVESLGSTYLGSEWTNGFGFLLLIAVLLLRPQGLLTPRRT